MASRPKRVRGRDIPAEEPEAQQPSPAAPPASSATLEREAPTLTRGRLIGLVVTVFLLINGAVFFLLRGVDDEIQWSEELSVADKTFASGNKAEGLKLLLEFGEHWPKANETYGFNEKAARYYSANEDWKNAADYFDRAMKIRPDVPGLCSRAGEAHRLAGNAERAMVLFAREIARGDESNDLANVRLGEYFIEKGEYARAYEYLQAVRDRDKWKAQLDAANAVVEREILAPARTMARGS